MEPTARYHIFDTALGACGIAWSDAGILRFQLPADDAQATSRLLRRRLADAQEAAPPPAIAAVIADVRRYFSGETVDFSGAVLDLSAEGDATREIYAAARRIGWGETTTYGALARIVGLDALGARTVGQAMAKNPVALLIPCHRVLAAGGATGGFSAPGGVAAKRRMLSLEGIAAPAQDSAQQSFGF